MEYSIILMLDYFKDTLVNVGLPEALLECYSNGVTRIGNKFLKCEPNRIGGEPSQIQSKTLSQKQSKTVIQVNSNQVKQGDHRRTDD